MKQSRSPKELRKSRRLWFFRLGAMALPIVLLAALELVLRVAGYGYDTAYLHRVDVRGRPHLRDNPHFTRLFFPEHLRPRQLPFTVAANKPARTVRIALLGGSAAMGIPEPAYGMAPILEEQLRARHPEVDVEVLNLASTAVNSHVMRRVADSLGPLQPDAIVIVMGNNEVVGPFGAGTVFTPAAPSSGLISFSLWMRGTRIGQLLRGATEALGRRAEMPTRWRGMEMFASHSVPYDDPALDRVRRHFEANLEAIARVGQRLDVPVVFTTLGVNLRHCGPFASTGTTELDEAARARFDRAYRTGDRLWERGEADSARVSYQDALAVLPTHADLHYRLGRLVLAAGDTAAAIAHLRDAREYDTLRFRADASINGVIRRVSLRYDHVILAELEAALAALSPAGLPGREMFLEHVHLDFTGNRVAARVLADALELALLDAMGAPVRADWLGTNEVATRLAYTAFGRREVLASTMAMIQRPPFANQSDHSEQVDYLARQLSSLAVTSEPEELEAIWPMIEASLAARPDAWIRRFRAASFLAEGLGDHGRAEQLWRGIAEEQPHFAAAINGWGRAVAAQGRFAQAVQLFERSLALDPHQPEVAIHLAMSLRHGAPNDPATRRRAFELQEGALLLDGTPASHEMLRELYENDAQWYGERGDVARVRILRTKLDQLADGATIR